MKRTFVEPTIVRSDTVRICSALFVNAISHPWRAPYPNNIKISFHRSGGNVSLLAKTVFPSSHAKSASVGCVIEVNAKACGYTPPAPTVLLMSMVTEMDATHHALMYVRTFTEKFILLING